MTTKFYVTLVDDYGIPSTQRPIWSSPSAMFRGDDFTVRINQLLRLNGYRGSSQNHPEDIVHGKVLIAEWGEDDSTYDEVYDDGQLYWIQRVPLHEEVSNVVLVLESAD